LGEAIALYFSFLKFYFVALAFPAFLGTIWWATGSTYSPSYGVMMSIWAVVFVETWRIKERTLAVQWGTYGFEEVETLRVCLFLLA
jgi:anoctamin-10